MEVIKTTLIVMATFYIAAIAISALFWVLGLILQEDYWRWVDYFKKPQATERKDNGGSDSGFI